MADRTEELKGLMKAGKTSEAVTLASQAVGYHEGEGFVFAALREEGTTPELLEAALEGFIRTRENKSPTHGYWTHSLSHFTKELWERRMLGWIKRLSEAAFKGAVELDNASCCDRLLYDFSYCAIWSDAPSDAGIMPESVALMERNERTRYAHARLEAGKFDSEAAYIVWRLRQPETWYSFNFDAQRELITVEGVTKLLERLSELGGDATEFDGVLGEKLREQLSMLEQEQVSPPRNRRLEWIKKGIEITHAALAAVSTLPAV